MFKFLIIFSLLISKLVFANSFVNIGIQSRISKDAVGDSNVDIPVLLRYGYKKEKWFYSSELSYFNQKTNEGSLNVKNDQYELSLKANYLLDYQESRFLNPYLSSGLGFVKNFIKYNFNSATSKDSSKLEPVLKLGAGLWGQVHPNIFFNAELNVSYSNQFNPEFIPDITMLVGYLF